MKGKIAYLTVVEKEIEIPDEVVEISKKSWVDWTEEEDEKLRIHGTLLKIILIALAFTMKKMVKII